MPIQNKRWSTATKDHVRDIVPKTSGVYELKCFGQLVYIGKADNLRRRILEHLNSKNPNGFRYEEVTGFFSSAKKREDQLLDRYEEKHGQLPPWNSNDTRG